MKCEEALAKTDAYIKNTLTKRELEEYLEHIRNCPECYDELEIYYTINVGMKYLEEEKLESYNIPRMLKADLKKKEEMLRRRRIIIRILCIAGFITVVSVVLFLLLHFGYIDLSELFA